MTSAQIAWYQPPLEGALGHFAQDHAGSGRSCRSDWLVPQRSASSTFYEAAVRRLSPPNLSVELPADLLMMLGRKDPLTIGTLADDLAVDRTTMTPNLKPLERHALLPI
jgi:hypothetical protein